MTYLEAKARQKALKRADMVWCDGRWMHMVEYTTWYLDDEILEELEAA